MTLEAEVLAQRNKDRELIDLYRQVDSGANPTTVTPVHNTQNEFYAYLLKRMANADAHTAMRFASMESLFTDAQISALIGITEQEAADWRVKVKDLASAQALIEGYDSGMKFGGIV